MAYRAWIAACGLCLAGAVHAGSIADGLRDALLGAGPPARAVVGPRLDSATRGCQRCHDGSGGPPVAANASGGDMRFQGPRSVDHPVGMRYGESARRDPAHYRSPENLDAALRLVDGRVGCLTCHRLRDARTVRAGSVERGCSASPELTSDRAAGGLCVACHLQ